MKIAITSVLFALSATAHADEWTGRDKTLHFAGGAIIGASVGAITTARTGFLVGTAVGLAKEVNDYRTKRMGGEHDPSYKDFAVTVAGAAFGAYVPGIVLSRRSISYNWKF